MSGKILLVNAFEVFDSPESLTVDVDAKTSAGKIFVRVCSGVWTGIYEALVLFDSDLSTCLRRGVDKAVQNVKEKIASAIEGVDAANQSAKDARRTSLDRKKVHSRRVWAQTQFWVSEWIWLELVQMLRVSRFTST